MMSANAPALNASQTTDLLGHVIDRRKSDTYSADLLAEAQVDEAWIEQKFATEFNPEIAQNLRKAVYAIGQGGDRWFSGGGGLSIGQASTILDYLVLVELLIQCRGDLADYRDVFCDCRDQLLLQLRRYTEDKPSHSLPRVDALVAKIACRLRP